MSTTKILLDADTGIDDSFALLYLLASPEAQLLGVVSTAGNVPVQQVAANNRAWLELVGRADIPVRVGSPVPLVQELHTTEETHGDQGLGYAQLPEASGHSQVSSENGVDMWIRMAREHPGEVVGLVTGPSTNLALAIRQDPELPRLLKRVVIMGGALNHPGNTTPVAEWNVFVDPEAAAEVFAAFEGFAPERLPILCPLDVTERIVLHPSDITRLAEISGCDEPENISPEQSAGTRSQASNVLVRHLSDAIRFYFEFHQKYDAGYFAHMHDPFAAAVALNPIAATLVPATIDVELRGNLTRAMTVADWKGLWGREPNALVVSDTDPQQFVDRLINLLAKIARSTPENAQPSQTFVPRN